MTTCRLVMPGEHVRGINLANAVSIAAYECYRQLESLYHLCNKRHEFSEASPDSARSKKLYNCRKNQL